MSPAVWVLFAVGAAVVAWKGGLLDQFKPMAPGRPGPQPVAPAVSPARSAASYAEQLLLRNITFPAELLSYAGDDLLKAGNFVKQQEALVKPADAWAAHQADQRTATLVDPLMPPAKDAPGPK